MKRSNTWSDEVKLYLSIGIAIALGFIAVLFYDMLHNWDGLPIALLWAFACVAFGGIVGFLFGVPRVIPEDQARSNNGVGADARANRLMANTNIEQISDWLTKIIVGVGLINLSAIPDYLDRLAQNLSKGLGVGYGLGAHSFSVALIVYFTIVGFIAGYLLTRLYISPLIGNADGRISYADGELSIAEVQVPEEIRRVVSEVELKNILAKPISGLGENQQNDENSKSAFRKLSTVREDKITDPVSFAAWATAQLNMGNHKKALDGFKRAIDIFTNDAKLRTEYALALQGLGFHEKALEELLSALQLNEGKQDVPLQGSIYQALTNVCLYLDPPEGFELCVKYGEKAVSNNNYCQNAWLWVNLAAAYGQQASYAKEHPEYSISYEVARQKALKAIRQALSLNSSTSATFKKLIQKDIPKPPLENDLEIFENDMEFRHMLGLTELTTVGGY